LGRDASAVGPEGDEEDRRGPGALRKAAVLHVEVRDPGFVGHLVHLAVQLGDFLHQACAVHRLAPSADDRTIFHGPPGLKGECARGKSWLDLRTKTPHNRQAMMEPPDTPRSPWKHRLYLWGPPLAVILAALAWGVRTW